MTSQSCWKSTSLMLQIKKHIVYFKASRCLENKHKESESQFFRSTPESAKVKSFIEYKKDFHAAAKQ